MKMKYLLAASVVSLTAGAALVATPAAAQLAAGTCDAED